MSIGVSGEGSSRSGARLWEWEGRLAWIRGRHCQGIVQQGKGNAIRTGGSREENRRGNNALWDLRGGCTIAFAS